nr:hypothetical protein BaRGS_002874 [Batillaria attramentaria]
MDIHLSLDNFTDGAISRNGQSAERDMKELEPWIAESTDDDNLALESGTNGWDAHDMFRRNAEQFDVKSTYDENLSQYTSVLTLSLLLSSQHSQYHQLPGYHLRCTSKPKALPHSSLPLLHMFLFQHQYLHVCPLLQHQQQLLQSLPDEEAEGRKTEQTPEEKRGETEEKKEEEKTEVIVND